MASKLYYILNMYGQVLFFIAASLITIVCFVKKPNIAWQLPFMSEGNFIQRHENAINHGIYTIILTISLVGIVLSFPRLLDMKAVLTSDFQIASGAVVSQDYANENEIKNRTVTIENLTTGEDEKYYIFRCPLLEEGEQITVYYYKNSRDGFLEQLR